MLSLLKFGADNIPIPLNYKAANLWEVYINILLIVKRNSIVGVSMIESLGISHGVL